MPFFSVFYIDLVVKALCFIVSMLIVYLNPLCDVASSAVAPIAILKCMRLCLQVLLWIVE